MRKVYLFLALAIPMMASAQLLEVTSTERVAQNADAKVAAFSPTGDYLLLTNTSNQGLQRFDLASKQATPITTADGAGYNVQIAQDGNEVVYREVVTDANHVRTSNIVRMNFEGKAKRQMVAKNQRSLEAMAVEVERPAFSVKDRQLMMTVNGETKIFSPNGQQYSYHWASLSPNGKKVSYYISAVGCFVCDIDGKNIQFIGHNCLAPVWYNDNIILGCDTKDNGEVVLESVIVAYSLDGKKQVLTNGEQIAVFPQAADGKIAYSTSEGEIYVMNVK
jgi:dipeptidyl aminopeptidase/acylaminoacyl peptidase